MVEIEFLKVGDKGSGDAILIRFTRSDNGEPAIVLVDGGYKEDGEKILTNAKKWFGSTRFDIVVSTHPDSDHLAGLPAVVEGAEYIGELWIHRPSLYITSEDVRSDEVEELISLAEAKGVLVRQPFTGDSRFGALTVVGPTEDFYTACLAAEEDPELKNELITESNVRGMRQMLGKKLRRAVSSIPVDTLTDNSGGTTPRNDHSVILNIEVDGYRLLLTGDAGVPGLTQAVEYIEAAGLNAKHPFPHVFQGPHHGSERNLDKATLDKLVGDHKATGRDDCQAFISASKKDPDHPHPKIVNALKHRQYKVYSTEGKNVHWHRGIDRRPDYNSAEELGWQGASHD